MVWTCEEENDDHRVNDGKPVNLHVTHCEVGVPTGRPPHLTAVPLYLVRKHQAHASCNAFSSVQLNQQRNYIEAQTLRIYLTIDPGLWLLQLKFLSSQPHYALATAGNQSKLIVADWPSPSKHINWQWLQWPTSSMNLAPTQYVLECILCTYTIFKSISKFTAYGPSHNSYVSLLPT